MKKKTIDTKSAATKLIDTQNRLVADSVCDKMIENVEDYAILLIDCNGVILTWNKGAKKIKGYKSKEIIGKNFRVFYTKEDMLSSLPDRFQKGDV